MAAHLPTICNINPRSLYNKVEEFCAFIKMESVDVVFVSETWEREELPLKDIQAIVQSRKLLVVQYIVNQSQRRKVFF